MRWQPGHTSPNVEDRRGHAIRRAVPLSLGGLLVLGVLSLLFGTDLLTPAISGGGGGGAPVATQPYQASPQEQQLTQFVSFVLDDAQQTWHRLLPGRYRDARLVLFTDATQSGCGYADSRVGPFYCPPDEKVYVDLSFYQELRARFGAPGDFAQAYVIAHEIGHHVQHITGIEGQVRQLQAQQPHRENDLSVRLELQADCYAGVWARSTQQRQLLEQGDFEEALGAAAAVGDDRIQARATGRIRPETWTHGSADQRMSWFRRGFDSGNPNACDTFQ